MAKLAPGWKKISEFVFRSPDGKRVSYAQYRDVTGLCDVCGVAIKGHPCCEACDIFTGLGHLESSSNYRGHELCGHCISRWKRLEEKIGRETTLEELKNPLKDDEEDPIMEVVR